MIAQHAILVVGLAGTDPGGLHECDVGIDQEVGAKEGGERISHRVALQVLLKNRVVGGHLVKLTGRGLFARTRNVRFDLSRDPVISFAAAQFLNPRFEYVDPFRVCQARNLQKPIIPKTGHLVFDQCRFLIEHRGFLTVQRFILLRALSFLDLT